MIRLSRAARLLPLLGAWLLLAALALPARAEIDIQQVTSPSGISAWLVEDHSLPFVALEIRFKGGGALDRPGKRAAVNLMAGLLEEGAGPLDAQGFAAAREALAAKISFDADEDTVSVSAKMLTEGQDEAARLLRLALNEPRFAPDALERVRGQVLAHLATRSTDPQAIASDRFDRLAWGDHPYGSYYGGTPESVAALTRDDIVTAWRDAIARDRVFVAAAGDIDAATLGALLDEVLGPLPPTGAPEPGPAHFQAPGRLEVVPFDTPQAVVVMGQEGMGRHDPDFIAAYVVNHIFGGGGFESRLMNELREKRGLTYGVRSYLVTNFWANSLVAWFSSSNDKAGRAVNLARAEWARIGRDGVTRAELDAAKRHLTGAYPLRFSGNGPIARILVGMQMLGLGPDYVARRNAMVEAVTLEQANRVARRLFRPEDLLVVAVGAPEGLKAP